MISSCYVIFIKYVIKTCKNPSLLLFYCQGSRLTDPFSQGHTDSVSLDKSSILIFAVVSIKRFIYKLSSLILPQVCFITPSVS